MSDQIRVVLSAPGEPACVLLIDNTLVAMQATLGGHLQLMPYRYLHDPFIRLEAGVYIDEDGTEKDLPQHHVRLLGEGYVRGALLVSHVDIEGAEDGFSEEAANELKALLDADLKTARQYARYESSEP